MDIQKMMQQAQVMQTRMQELQEQLAQTAVQGQSGGGMVTVIMKCSGYVDHINVSPEIVSVDDKETMEDLIIAALNNARENADRKMAEETQSLMQEMGIPSGAGGLPGF